MTRKQFETAYTDYPFNPIDHGKTRVSQYADGDGFVEVAEAPTGFMVIKRHVLTEMMKRYPELNYVPDGPPNNSRRIYIGASSTACTQNISCKSMAGGRRFFQDQAILRARRRLRFANRPKFFRAKFCLRNQALAESNDVA
jgi:hypothetical protein